MSEENKCPNKAEVVIPWGGKIMKGCKKHASNMCMLAEVMGSPIECRELPQNSDQCEFQNDLDND